MINFNDKANFIWSVADLLRGDFKQSEYGKVILPFTVLRRFDCVLAPSKAKILEMNKTITVSNKIPIFRRQTGHDYYNISKFDFSSLLDDSNAIETNLMPWTAAGMQSKGDTIADLVEDLAAEQKARATYDNILRLCDDPDVADVIKFLREREIVHYQRFGEALRLTQDRLPKNNIYVTNPSFDR